MIWCMVKYSIDLLICRKHTSNFANSLLTSNSTDGLLYFFTNGLLTLRSFSALSSARLPYIFN